MGVGNIDKINTKLKNLLYSYFISIFAILDIAKNEGNM